MPYSRSIDIDSLSDFKMVEFFGKNKLMNKYTQIFNLKNKKYL